MAIDGVTSCMKIREVNKNKKQFVELRKSEFIKENIDETLGDMIYEKSTFNNCKYNSFTVVFSFNDRIEDWRQILGNRCI